jgi:hypothetical protein
MNKRFAIVVLVGIALTVLSACAGGGLSLAPEPTAGTAATTADLPAEEGALAPVDTSAQAPGDGVAAEGGLPTGEGMIVDVTPMSDAELAAQAPGETAPGGAAGEIGDQTDPGGAQPPASAGVATYSDPRYGFAVNYPADFVVAPQDTGALAQFSPTPEASIYFMNPTMASGDLAGLEPPDLEVRVYPAGTAASLEAWLIESLFVPADTSPVGETVQSNGVSGLKVCASTMIAPGCSVYYLRNGRIYQLTPATLEGETMAASFTFTS